MKLKIALIRSGMTRSGNEGRKLGLKDEPLMNSEKTRLQSLAAEGAYPEATLAYVSTLYRCRETAAIIYPQSPAVVLNSLRAMDVGEFEGKTHNESLQSQSLRAWMEETSLTPCPGGEDLYSFGARCNQGFRSITNEMCSKGIESASIVTHGMVINAIMQRYCIPRSAYRNWEVYWGGGYSLEYDSLDSAAVLQAVL